MKRLLPIICACISAVSLFCCCERTPGSSATAHKGRVLVMHTTDSLSVQRSNYSITLLNAILENKANPEITDLYSCSPENGLDEASQKKLAALQEQGWAPDVICISNDNLLESVLKGQFDKWLDITGNSYPIVAAGLHTPDWTLIHDYPDIATCIDLVDFANNLSLAKSISENSIITIELDYNDHDMQLRDQLSTEIRRPPFVDNSDFHIGNIHPDELKMIYRDSIFVNVFSNANPERNLSFESTKDYRSYILRDINSTTVLSVKNDSYSRTLLNHCTSPQFTAVREGFHDGTGRFLCGYFASTETVAKDQGTYVAMVLNGARANNLPIVSHKKGYYADNDALSFAGFHHNYFAVARNNPIKVTFEVEGISFFRKYRKFLLPAFAIVLMAILYACFIAATFMAKKPFEALNEEKTKLERDYELFSLAIRSTDCIFVNNREEVVALQTRMHPDETIILNKILYGTAGYQKDSYPIIRLTNDNGKTWRRWQFRRGTAKDNASRDLPGVFIDVEETFEFKEQMDQYATIAEQTRLKEDFVQNITHEIRTPLNAIVGFSQILGSDDGSMTEEERQEIARYVHENNSNLSSIIETILVFSRIESGRIIYEPEDVDIAQLMTDVYGIWKEKAGSNVEFILDRGRANVFAMLDRKTAKDIMSQYLSNALKFTETGYVKMGWDYDFDNETVLLYVEDTGRGISEEKRKFIYNMFWKDDMFMSGVGLGLSVAKTYTEKMGGTVEFQSMEGIGSCFASKFRAQIRHSTVNS